MATYYYSTTGTWSDWTDSTSTAVWTDWNSTSTCTSTCSSSSQYVWVTWTSGSTTASATDNTIVWYDWNDKAYSYKATVVKPREETAEERQAREERERKEREEFKAREKERQEKEAARKEKARQLLREVLDEKQNEQLDKKGHFELVSVGSGRRYRIHTGRTRNVDEIDCKGKVLKHMCFHPRENVHDYDTMVAQKIMLEYDEEAARKVANFS